MPYTRPAVVPIFAELDATDPTSGQANVTTPDATHQNYGWAYQEFPPRQYFNWLHRWTSRWIQWLDQEHQASSVDVDESLSYGDARVAVYPDFPGSTIGTLSIDNAGFVQKCATKSFAIGRIYAALTTDASQDANYFEFDLPTGFAEAETFLMFPVACAKDVGSWSDIPGIYARVYDGKIRFGNATNLNGGGGVMSFIKSATFNIGCSYCYLL